MKTLKKILAGAMLAMSVLIPATVMAVDPVTRETDWTPQLYSSKDGAASSTHAVTGTGISWLVIAIGGSPTFTIWTTTQTYKTGDPVMVASSTTYALDGRPLSAGFSNAMNLNPRIVWHGLPAGTTVYTYIEYGETRK